MKYFLKRLTSLNFWLSLASFTNMLLTLFGMPRSQALAIAWTILAGGLVIINFFNDGGKLVLPGSGKTFTSFLPSDDDSAKQFSESPRPIMPAPESSPLLSNSSSGPSSNPNPDRSRKPGSGKKASGSIRKKPRHKKHKHR